MDKPRCAKNGCNNLPHFSISKDTKKRYYSKFCNSHIREHYGKRELYNKRDSQKKNIKYRTDEDFRKRKKELGRVGKKWFGRSFCSICGWDKTICDMHRIRFGCNGGKYVEGNLVSLCPNCHRLVHRGLLKIK